MKCGTLIFVTFAALTEACRHLHRRQHMDFLSFEKRKKYSGWGKMVTFSDFKKFLFLFFTYLFYTDRRSGTFSQTLTHSKLVQWICIHLYIFKDTYSTNYLKKKKKINIYIIIDVLIKYLYWKETTPWWPSLSKVYSSK